MNAQVTVVSIEKMDFVCLAEYDAIGAVFKLLPVATTKNRHTRKAMTTTDIKSVPSFWKKLWNAMLNVFRRNKARTCSAEHQQPALQAEEPGRAVT